MKRIRIKRNQTRSWWKQVFTAAGVVLLAFFVYHTCQLYLDRKASAEQAAQWRQDQIGSTAKGMGDRIEYEGKTYRRNTYVKAILCMGIDRTGSLEESRVAGQGGQADGIFLIAQDTARDRVKILMIPRDTMTEITLTDLSGNELGQGIQHLALAYAYGDGREKSCQYMADAVSRLLDGLSIDGYMAFSMSVIPVVNDGVGGVAVTIKDRELEKADPDFIYGKDLTLRGKQAEAYIRYRDTKQAQSAIGRTERQKSYIEGFLKAARKKAGRDDGFVPWILKEIEPYMITDMTKDRYLDMALAFIEKGQDVGIGDMLTLPGNAVETSIYDEYYPDKDQIRPLILELFYRAEE